MLPCGAPMDRATGQQWQAAGRQPAVAIWQFSIVNFRFSNNDCPSDLSTGSEQVFHIYFSRPYQRMSCAFDTIECHVLSQPTQPSKGLYRYQRSVPCLQSANEVCRAYSGVPPSSAARRYSSDETRRRCCPAEHPWTVRQGSNGRLPEGSLP